MLRTWVQDIYFAGMNILTKNFYMIKIDKNKENNEENSLEGVVSSVESDAKSVKVTVDIGHYDKIISVMQIGTLKGIDLKSGNPVAVQINAHDIMLGR